MRPREIKICVFVDSDKHSSAELTSMLGLKPDEAWDLGSPFTFRAGGKPKPHAFSRWAAVERAKGNDDWDAATDRLFSRLQPLEAKFQGLPPEAHVSFTLFVTEDNDVFGLGLDKRHVRFIAAIGASIEQSFVVSGADPSEAPNG